MHGAVFIVFMLKRVYALGILVGVRQFTLQNNSVATQDVNRTLDTTFMLLQKFHPDTFAHFQKK